MYISQILEYLIWPGFIFIAWLIVKVALTAYEKKFQEKEEVFSEEQGKK